LNLKYQWLNRDCLSEVHCSHVVEHFKKLFRPHLDIYPHLLPFKACFAYPGTSDTLIEVEATGSLVNFSVHQSVYIINRATT